MWNRAVPADDGRPDTGSSHHVVVVKRFSGATRFRDRTRPRWGPASGATSNARRTLTLSSVWQT
jgi:hypothetical protein